MKIANKTERKKGKRKQKSEKKTENQKLHCREN